MCLVLYLPCTTLLHIYPTKYYFCHLILKFNTLPSTTFYKFIQLKINTLPNTTFYKFILKFKILSTLIYNFCVHDSSFLDLTFINTSKQKLTAHPMSVFSTIQKLFTFKLMENTLLPPPRALKNLSSPC